MALRREQVLEHRIERIKRELHALGDLRPGSLSKQYNVCGVEGCRCKASPPQKHGPYYQLSFTRKGKATSRFVRREEVAAVRRQLNSYAKLRALVDDWIDTAMELSALRLEQQREHAVKPPQSRART
ncbi:MAG TPA: DUF6788 family protein [Myxococcota bacterium]|nr:DUF6788 family protein [Myxococcota bacterium]